jgi:3-keto-disaccharide hydrolase
VTRLPAVAVIFLLPTTADHIPNMPMINRFVFRPCGALALLLAGAAAVAAPAVNQLTEAEKAAGWKLLFDGKTTEGWHTFKKQTFPAKGWEVEDGWLHCLGKGGGDIVSDAEYGDFELTWEWKQVPDGNSGLKYFVTDTRPAALGHEYQMIDDERNGDAKLANGKRVTAAFYDVLKPTVTPPTRPPGEINESRVVVKGNHVEHWLNGVKVLEYECGSDAIKAAVAASKFKTTPGFADKLTGHILLQDHHSEVWFRNLKIRE